MNVKKAETRLKLARKRTENIYKTIGNLSSHFAGLELQLVETLSKCINSSEPHLPETVFSQLSFRQCTNALRQYVKSFFDKPEIIEQAKAITKRLDDVATKRNEIIHSSWLAYSTGDYGQHRARPKGKKTAGLHKHKENPEKKMSELIYEIDEVLFDLICFEDLIIKGNSEQQH